MAPQRKSFPRLFLARAEPFRLAGARVFLRSPERGDYEAWAGLRPGSPDELPIVGETAISGFFAATGHYRDGILLAPVTAQVMSDLLVDGSCGHDLDAFSPNRFLS